MAKKTINPKHIIQIAGVPGQPEHSIPPIPPELYAVDNTGCVWKMDYGRGTLDLEPYWRLLDIPFVVSDDD